MEFTGADIQYIVNVLAQRPLGEALPLYLKLTKQQLVPLDDSRKASVNPISTRRAGDPHDSPS